MLVMNPRTVATFEFEVRRSNYVLSYSSHPPYVTFSLVLVCIKFQVNVSVVTVFTTYCLIPQ
jgi:hypothetical protein